MKQFVRLQKYISQSGVTSRRKAEELILGGRVRVNNHIITELGTKVDPETDTVFVDENIVSPEKQDKVYILFHKPRCCVTTLSDPEGRPTVMDYIKGISQRIYPVGRLDYYSEGLLILTNDGDLAHKIMHPSFEITKVYEVKVFGFIDPRIIASLTKGAEVEGEFLKPLSVKIIKRLPNKTWLEFKLVEGKNREIRKLCEHFGLVIDKLRRVAIEGLTVNGIAPAKYHRYSKGELLKGLGMDNQGKKIKQVDYLSPRKTLKPKINTRLLKIKKLATDESFKKYNRDQYLKTMTLHKLINEQEAMAAEEAETLSGHKK